MKNKLVLFFFINYLILDVASQPTTFLKTYNAGNSGFSVHEMNGNSFVIAGGTDFYYNFHWFTLSPLSTTNIHLIKTAIDGSLIWERIFNLPGSRTLATWMEPVQNNGYIITGRSNHETTWPPDSNDIILLKTDTSGNIQWSKVYDTGKDELGFCVRPTFDGGFIVSGFHDAAPFSLTVNTYAMLIKTDIVGNILWEKKYSLAVRDLDTGEPFPWVVRQTADSGYVLTGTTAGSHAADVYVIRTNSSGDVLWAKSYEHDNTLLSFSVGLDIIESSTGDFIIAGSMDKDQSLNQYNYPYILKLNSSGNSVDAKYFDSAPLQIFQSGFSSVEQTPDGGFFFTGMGGYGGFGMQAQLLKTDADFHMEWSRTYTNDGAATVGSRSGCRTTDGGYVFTGKRVMSGTILLKTDNFGLIGCKNPGVLLEMIPGVIMQNRFPSTISGVSANNIILTSLVHLADTTTLCPVGYSTLPIELLSFSASPIANQQVQLQWKTASEINNDYFIVWKSADGNEFNEVGRIKGAGNSKAIREYSLLDKYPDVAGIVYYRLEQIDYDGKRKFSEVVSVKLNMDELNIIKVETDYNSHSVKILLESNGRKKVIVSITDALGKNYVGQSIILDGGIQWVSINTPALSNGIYFLLISDGKQRILKKIIY